VKITSAKPKRKEKRDRDHRRGNAKKGTTDAENPALWKQTGPWKRESKGRKASLNSRIRVQARQQRRSTRESRGEREGVKVKTPPERLSAGIWVSGCIQWEPGAKNSVGGDM